MEPQVGGPPARYLFFVSGIVGLAVGLGIEWYRLILLDPVVGSENVASWIVDVRTAVLVGSVAVVIYGLVIEGLFGNAVGYVLIGAMLAQWGVPSMMLLEAVAGGLRSSFGYFVLVFSGLHVLIAGSVAVVFTYQGWERLAIETDDAASAATDIQESATEQKKPADTNGSAPSETTKSDEQLTDDREKNDDER